MDKDNTNTIEPLRDTIVEHLLKIFYDKKWVKKNPAKALTLAELIEKLNDLN